MTDNSSLCLWMSVCAYRIYVCVFICVYVCICQWLLYICMCVYVYICVYVWLCLHVVCVSMCMFMCECVYVCSFQDSLYYINMCCFKGQKRLPTLTHNLLERTLMREFLLQCLALPDFSDDQHWVPQMDPSGMRIQGVGVVLSEARVLRLGSGFHGSHARYLVTWGTQFRRLHAQVSVGIFFLLGTLVAELFPQKKCQLALWHMACE